MWIEATDPVHVVRADVVPHLDGADVSIVIRRAAEAAGPEDPESPAPASPSAGDLEPDPAPAEIEVAAEVYPATVTLDTPIGAAPDALRGAGPPLARAVLPPESLAPGDVVRLDAAFLLADPALWSPASPNLYVLRVTASIDGRVVDELHETFGFRQVAVDPERPVVTLNGAAVMLPGVAIHDQHLAASGSRIVGSLPTPVQVRAQLEEARSVGARLIRTGHSPANPVLLDLADRLGFAIWEEIPLYHYTPQTFDIAMSRGIPQQMLREMALRDMNRPSVLFHGLANESTGEDERRNALRQLHDIDREIDGTRLTGQASYGFNPADRTSEPLDVNGFTSYHGVFYGSDPHADTARP